MIRLKEKSSISNLQSSIPQVSEGNVVVAQRLGGFRVTRSLAARVIAAAAHRHSASATTAEEHHAIATDLRGVALVAVLVVPLACLQATLNVDLLALGEVFGEGFGGLAPQHHAVPFGFFLFLPGLVVPDLGGRHIERRHGGAAWCVAE